MLDVRNVSSDKGVFDITRKEITIPLVDYTDPRKQCLTR